LRFVIDAQLPPSLADRLRTNGHIAEHVYDVKLGAAADAEIWRYVCHHSAVLLTKDQDFVGLAGTAPEGVAVVWIRLGNTTNKALWSALEPLIPEIVEALGSGETLLEIV
jgi:predicted nuclease of predicted toxin-antitoxin system